MDRTDLYLFAISHGIDIRQPISSIDSALRNILPSDAWFTQSTKLYESLSVRQKEEIMNFVHEDTCLSGIIRQTIPLSNDIIVYACASQLSLNSNLRSDFGVHVIDGYFEATIHVRKLEKCNKSILRVKVLAGTHCLYVPNTDNMKLIFNKGYMINVLSKDKVYECILLYPTVRLKKGSKLNHSTLRKGPKQRADLAQDMEGNEDNLRWKTIETQYTKLKEGEFPTDLTHPKWFSLPPFFYGGDVDLQYSLLRDVRLVDLRDLPINMRSRNLVYGQYRDISDDGKTYIARSIFPKDSWPYRYYSASKFEVEYPSMPFGPIVRLPIDGWIAYDNNDEWTEVAFSYPSEVIDPRYKVM